MEPSRNDLQERLKSTRLKEHHRCVLCGPAKILGEELEYRVEEDGSVMTRFRCDEIFQSYPGIVHGGVISMLIDGTMTNCLFARGKRAVTGNLSIRYIHPVATGKTTIVTARIIKSRSPLHVLESELLQEGNILVRATGKFMERPPAPFE